MILGQCITDLNRTVMPDPRNKEICIRVDLHGYGWRFVWAPPSFTLRQLRNLLAQQLGIKSTQEARDFGFFQVTEGIASHRLMLDQTQVSRVLENFAKLQNLAGQPSHLLF